MVTLYARSDLASVAVSTESGGCGARHDRPVIGGAPVRLWHLDCLACTAALKNDDLWSLNPAKIPLTPDEENMVEQMREDEARRKAVEQSVESFSHREKVQAELAAQRTREEYETERSMLELRLAQMSAEMDRLRGLLESPATRSAQQRAAAPEVVVRAAQTPEDAAAAPRRVQRTEPRPNAPERAQARPRPACTTCGGPLRAPGAKGPTPKGTCLACRAKARAGAGNAAA